MTARYGIPLVKSVEESLTLGGENLAVDGVLLIGEHGDYPFNEKGQHLYPRRELFEKIVNVFRKTGKTAPVYNDKHFSYSWENAEWMYRQSQELGFPMTAGSSVPVAWRRPALSFRPGIELDSALSVGFAGEESYGFHTLEVLQSFVERRRSGDRRQIGSGTRRRSNLASSPRGTLELEAPPRCHRDRSRFKGTYLRFGEPAKSGSPSSRVFNRVQRRLSKPPLICRAGWSPNSASPPKSKAAANRSPRGANLTNPNATTSASSATTSKSSSAAAAPAIRSSAPIW